LKVIIPLAGFGKRMRPHTWSRAKPLLNVAGNTIVGHLLNLMSDITTEEVIFVVGNKGNEIDAWIRQNYPHLDAHFVVQAEPLGQAQAVALCRDFLDGGEVLVASGASLLNLNYKQISEPGADGVILVQEVDEPHDAVAVLTDEKDVVTGFVEKADGPGHNRVVTGYYWFRNGRSLLQFLPQNETIRDVCQQMLTQGAVLKAKTTFFWMDTSRPESLLEANKRLLGMGYGSDDAVERSYAEDFTALPPVFIHESAVVTNTVIGPYVSIAAGATIKDAIVRNSIIDAGAAVTDCILDGALIGENCQITGQSKALFVGDNSIVDLG
jgi:glucose-1-phosphate thymidylyltransferase